MNSCFSPVSRHYRVFGAPNYRMPFHALHLFSASCSPSIVQPCPSHDGKRCHTVPRVMRNINRVESPFSFLTNSHILEDYLPEQVQYHFHPCLSPAICQKFLDPHSYKNKMQFSFVSVLALASSFIGVMSAPAPVVQRDITDLITLAQNLNTTLAPSVASISKCSILLLNQCCLQ